MPNESLNTWTQDLTPYKLFFVLLSTAEQIILGSFIRYRVWRSGASCLGRIVQGPSCLTFLSRNAPLQIAPTGLTRDQPWLVLSPPFSCEIQDVGQFADRAIRLCRYSGQMHRGRMRLEYIAKNCPTRTSLNLNFSVEVALFKKSDHKLANETSCSAECLRFWWTESSSSCLLFTGDKARFKACGHTRM